MRLADTSLPFAPVSYPTRRWRTEATHEGQHSAHPRDLLHMWIQISTIHMGRTRFRGSAPLVQLSRCSLALVGDSSNLCFCLGIQVGATLLDRLEGFLIQLVNKRDTGRDVDACNVLVGDFVEVLDDGAQ